MEENPKHFAMQWKAIWENPDRIERHVLDCLIKVDGFDSAAGSLSVDTWLPYCDDLYHKLSLSEDATIYDVGCGAGAFLYPFFCRGHFVGVDYSRPLIDIAKGFFPKGEFNVGDAINLDTTSKYDIVLSHSVFQYFPSHSVAKQVLTRMIEKARCMVAVFDVNDANEKDVYHSHRLAAAKANGVTEKEYWEKYKDLKHQFYPKSFFQDIADKANLSCCITPQSNKDYGNAYLRYNVILKK